MIKYSDDNPINNAYVYIKKKKQVSDDNFIARCITKKDKKCKITLNIGVYTIRAECDGYNHGELNVQIGPDTDEQFIRIIYLATHKEFAKNNVVLRWIEKNKHKHPKLAYKKSIV